MSDTVERKLDTKKRLMIVCQECKTKSPQNRKWQKFCSAKCKLKSWARSHPRIALNRETI